MTEDMKGLGFVVCCLVMLGFFTICVFSVVKGIMRSIRDKKEERSGKDVLSAKSSNGHDLSEVLPPDYIQFQ